MATGNGNSHSNGNLDDIREILRDTVILQNQQAQIILKHSEMLAAHDAGIAAHDERMARFDERMERIQTSIQALVEISDDLIRNKADRKKRS